MRPLLILCFAIQGVVSITPVYVTSTSGSATGVISAATSAPAFVQPAANTPVWVPYQDPTTPQPTSGNGVYGQWAQASFDTQFTFTDLLITGTTYFSGWSVLGSNDGVAFTKLCPGFMQLQLVVQYFDTGCSSATAYSVYRLAITLSSKGGNVSSIVFVTGTSTSVAAVVTTAPIPTTGTVVPPTPPVAGAVLLVSQHNLVLPVGGNVAGMHLFVASGTPGEDFHYVSHLNTLNTYPPPYEFVLRYPDLGLSNRWSQLSPPYAIGGRVANFLPISLDIPNISPGKPFGGLFKTGYDSFIAGGEGGFIVSAAGYSTPDHWYSFNYQRDTNWSELWLIPSGPQQPVPQLPVVVPPASTPVPSGTSTYTGFDIVFISGQSNSLGFDSNTGFAVVDNTDTFPVYYWNGQQVQQANETYHKINGGDSGSEFGVQFAKHYISSGFLTPGRAVVIVHTGAGGTGFFRKNYGTGITNLPGPNTTLDSVWLSSARCEASYACLPEPNNLFQTPPVPVCPVTPLPLWNDLTVATEFGQANTHSNLFTQAMYLVDTVLSVNPATNTPKTSGPIAGSAYPTNRVVAVLWHQGESDGGDPIVQWATCMEDLIAAWRLRYATTEVPVIPFLTGGNADNYILINFKTWLRKNFGQGRYPTNPASVCDSYCYFNASFAATYASPPDIGLSTGTAMLGFADSETDFYWNGENLNNNGAHLYQYGYQQLGIRYAQSYAAMFGGTTSPPSNAAPPVLSNPPPSVSSPPPSVSSPPLTTSTPSPPVLSPPPAISRPPPTAASPPPTATNPSSPPHASAPTSGVDYALIGGVSAGAAVFCLVSVICARRMYKRARRKHGRKAHNSRAIKPIMI